MIVPLLEVIHEQGLLDLLGELCSSFTTCGLAEQSQQDERRCQPLLSVDQEGFRDTFGHRLGLERHDRADKVGTGTIEVLHLDEVIPKGLPLRFVPAVRPLE